MTFHIAAQIVFVVSRVWGRENAANQINNELITAYWNIGRVIVENEQSNDIRAEYGKETLKQLSRQLTLLMYHDAPSGKHSGVWRLTFSSSISKSKKGAWEQL